MNTWVNKRLAHGAYDINELVNQGQEVKLIADAGEAQSYLLSDGNQKSVIKVYKFALNENLRAAINVVQKLRHPAIAKVSLFGEISGHAYEIREYYEQCNLEAASENFCTAIFEIADAINELHIEGFSSLDIKPENIIFTNKSAVIVDIGSFVGFKSNGEMGYSAPELDNGSECDESDYYSLGISLFEIITGVNPFRGMIPQKKEDKKLTTDLHNIKLNPRWWFPSSASNNLVGTLILNLINPDPSKRWGFSEILDWYKTVQTNGISNEIASFRAMFNQKLSYHNVVLNDTQALIVKLAEKWDFSYLFDQGSALSGFDIYLANKVGLYAIYTNPKEPSKLTNENKITLLIKLYCEFTPSSDIVFLKGNRFNDIYELGNFVFSTATRLYFSNLTIQDGDYNRFYNSDDFRMLSSALAANSFSCYMAKCRQQNVDARIRIISDYENSLLQNRDFYGIIYGLIVISYAIMGKCIFRITLPNSNKTVDINSLWELADTLMRNMESIDDSVLLLGTLVYQNEISPIVKAWSDSTKMNY